MPLGINGGQKSEAWHAVMRGDKCWTCHLQGGDPKPVMQKCCEAGWCSEHYSRHVRTLAEKGWPHTNA